MTTVQRRRPRGKVTYNPAQVAAQQEEVFQRTVRGQTVRQISEAMGIGLATIQRRKKDAINAHVAPGVEEHRKLQDQRLEMLLQKLLAGVDMDDPDAAIPANTAMAILKLFERQARLHGLDAPMKSEVEVTEVTPEDVALREMLQHGRAKLQRERAAAIQGITS